MAFGFQVTVFGIGDLPAKLKKIICDGQPSNGLVRWIVAWGQWSLDELPLDDMAEVSQWALNHGVKEYLTSYCIFDLRTE